MLYEVITRPRSNRSNGGRLGRRLSRIGVEAECVLPHPDEVGPHQQALPLHGLFVHERAVRARVDESYNFV